MKEMISLIAILFLVGCATIPHIPVELQYTTPPGPSTELATITGSQTDVFFFDDYTVYILGLDGKRVMLGRKGWNTPIQIQPGQHNITTAFVRGMFWAQADLMLQAVAGAQYQVRFSSDVWAFGPNSYCDFWIVDVTTQKPITDIKRGKLGGGQTPVFIPVRY